MNEPRKPDNDDKPTWKPIGEAAAKLVDRLREQQQKQADERGKVA